MDLSPGMPIRPPYRRKYPDGYLLKLPLSNVACRSHEGEEETKEFFKALDSHSNSRSAHWWRKLKAQTARRIFERLRKNGELQDMSAQPIYRGHVKSINRVLSELNTWEAAKRKFALSTLQRCAGMHLHRVK